MTTTALINNPRTAPNAPPNKRSNQRSPVHPSSLARPHATTPPAMMETTTNVMNATNSANWRLGR